MAARAGLSEPTVYGGVERKRFIIETNGCGVAFVDYDNDDWVDILLLNGTRLEGFPKGKEPTNKLYRNNRDGTFQDVTTKAGLNRTGWASGVSIGDYDNDGDSDFFITYWGQNLLYRNNGGTFTDVTATAGLAAGHALGSGSTFVIRTRRQLDVRRNYLKSIPTGRSGQGANALEGRAVNAAEGSADRQNLSTATTATARSPSLLKTARQGDGGYSRRRWQLLTMDGWTDIMRVRIDVEHVYAKQRRHDSESR